MPHCHCDAWKRNCWRRRDVSSLFLPHRLKRPQRGVSSQVKKGGSLQWVHLPAAAHDSTHSWDYSHFSCEAVGLPASELPEDCENCTPAPSNLRIRALEEGYESAVLTGSQVMLTLSSVWDLLNYRILALDLPRLPVSTRPRNMVWGQILAPSATCR